MPAPISFAATARVLATPSPAPKAPPMSAPTSAVMLGSARAAPPTIAPPASAPLPVFQDAPPPLTAVLPHAAAILEAARAPVPVFTKEPIPMPSARIINFAAASRALAQSPLTTKPRINFGAGGFGAAPASQGSPAVTSMGLTDTFADGGVTPSDGGGSSGASSSSDGVLAQATTFVAQNKTAFMIAGAVGVVAVGAGLFFALRK